MSLHDKNSQQTKHRRKLSQPDKGHLQKFIANIKLNGKIENSFRLRSRTRYKIFALTTFTQHCTESPTQCIKTRKRKMLYRLGRNK